MFTRRAAVVGVAAAAVLALTACEPLDMSTSGSSHSTVKSGKSTKKSSGKVVVRHQTKKSTATARSSVTVRSGSTARVSSTGGGRVSCRIVVNGRTVADKSGSSSVTCSTKATR